MASESSASVYRREGDHALIPIRLREIRQSFHTLDPAPVREKDPDEGAEDYLIGACREAGSHRPLRFIVYLPGADADSDAVRPDMLRLLRYGAASFAIGILFLSVCLYDWWPLARRRALLRRLAAIPIEARGAP